MKNQQGGLFDEPHAQRRLTAAACTALAGPALALNLCVEGAYPPFSETAADGSIVGFDIDIGHGALHSRWARPASW